MSTSRPNCSEDCIRRELARLQDPDAPIMDQIYLAACAVAATCGKLTVDELHVCASRLFDVAPACELSKVFVIAYQTERDACAGRLEMERKQAAQFRCGQGTRLLKGFGSLG